MFRRSATNLLIFYSVCQLITIDAETPRPGPILSVSSPEDSFINAIEGFGTDLQCYVNSCPPPNRKVKWYKDNKLIADGIRIVSDNSRLSIRHNIGLDHTKDCTGRCSSSESCGSGFHCLDNSCCQCSQEEFTLVVNNLTLADSGIYQCRLDGGNYMEFEVQILEGGTFPNFAQNLTFDYDSCCQKNEISTECRPMCKPGALETHKFDPIPCQKEFGKLLSCATNNGNTSHVHCCRLHFVPPFCWDYCSGTTTLFERANRLCVYWMPEIFQCYEQAYLPLPGHPEQLVVNPMNSTSLYACWLPPKQRGNTVKFYSVRYQEVPRFPFFGGAIPLLTGEENQSGFEEMGAPPIPIDSDHEADTSSIIRRPILSPADGHERGAGGPSIPVASESGSESDRIRNVDRPLPVNVGKRKRQTLVITTHNFATNETEIREYRYEELNTTDTCAVIGGLKPATQYTVYVTATNDFGLSLPSVKASAATADVLLTNVTLPNIRECCVSKHVDVECVTKMCDVSQPPSAVGAFDIALTCRNEFPQVAPCLADGRDHTECCKMKGVGGECLKLCDGTASYVGVSSVLCLSLDMSSIYSCLRQGYETHPSPPTNVTVTKVTGTAATIRWNPPKDNGEKVISYSLFYRTRTANDYNPVYNVTSPFEMIDLLPDTEYSIYLIAVTPEGKSLKSTVVQFSTGEHAIDGICQFGQPLRDAFGFPVICSPRVSCPVLFDCVDGGSDDDDAKYCCPSRAVVEPDGRIPEPNITQCCAAKGVRDKCLDLCSYETTTEDLVRNGRDCISHVKTWIGCGGDGRDDRACCVREGVPEPCTDFCYPVTVETMQIHAEHIPCVKYVREIAKCGLEGIYNLPGPPRNLRVFGQGSNWVALLWDKPLQTVPIDAYELWLADGSKVLTFNTSAVSLTVPDLKRDVRYTAHVRSLNEKGASVPTENITFTLGEEEASGSTPSTLSSGNLPSAPSNVTVAWYRSGKANLTWSWTRESLNKKSIQNFEFNVSYGESLIDKNRIQWKSARTKEFYQILDNLNADSAYDAYVSVKDLDSKQEGFPSSVVTFKTSQARSSPTAEIQAFPSGPLSVGDRVSVSCTGRGDPKPNVTLFLGDRKLSWGMGSTSTVIDHVSLDDSNDFFECVADNGDFIPVRSIYTLKIRYSPKVTSYIDPTTVVEGLPARLTCKVRGYPTPDVTWYYQTEEAKRQHQIPVQLSADEKYLIETKGGAEDNSFNATLTVQSAGENAAGYYYCRGCNDLGCTNTSLKLIVDPWPVPQGPDYLLSCCKQQGILPECMSACTLDIDVSVYEKNTQCIAEFPKLLACAKDGVDQTGCCASRGVSSECLSYCNRRLVTTSETRYNFKRCSDYTGPMISCADEAHKIVPGTPSNVRMQPLDQNAANVTWDAPTKRGENIPMYVVYYKKQGDDRYSTARTEKTWIKLSNLDQASDYNVTVIAANNYGFSLFSPLISRRIFGDGNHNGNATGGTTRSAAGTVLAILFCLLFVAVIILSAIYFTRRPHRLPTFLLKLTQRRPARATPNANGGSGNGAVAFENPGYDREAQVRGLPGDKLSDSTYGNENGSNGSVLNGHATSGWEQPQLETPQDSPAPQRSGKYTQLN